MRVRTLLTSECAMCACGPHNYKIVRVFLAAQSYLTTLEPLYTKIPLLMIGRWPARGLLVLLIHYFFVLYRRPLVVLRSLALDVKAPIMALMNTQTGNIFALVECNKRIYFFSIKCSKKKSKKVRKNVWF